MVSGNLYLSPFPPAISPGARQALPKSTSMVNPQRHRPRGRASILKTKMVVGPEIVASRGESFSGRAAGRGIDVAWFMNAKMER